MEKISVILSVFIFHFGCVSTNTASQNPIPPNYIIRTVSTGHNFTEGPVYSHKLNHLYFSDLYSSPKTDKIFYIDLKSKKKTTWVTNSDGVNGLHFDNNGKLIAARAGKAQSVVVLDRETGKTQEFLAQSFKNLSFKAPNDIEIDKKNNVYFTDPKYRFKQQKNKSYLISRKVYKFNQKTKVVEQLSFSFSQPNGLVLSPDQNDLYVADSQENLIYKINLETNKQSVFFQNSISSGETRGSAGVVDGLAIDLNGNLYVTGNKRITVLKPTGEVWGEILFSDKVTNCAFGGKDNRTLFVTGTHSVYSVKLLVPGA